MKKITSLAILALVLATTFIEADTSSLYIGLEKSLSYKVKNTAKGGGYSESNTESPSLTSIKIGGISGDKKIGNRYEFLYNFGDKSANPIGGLEGEDVMSLNLHYHFTLPSISPKEEILPYIRLGFSYVISNDKYHVEGTYDEETNYSAAGLLIGVGTYYSINDNINLTAGFDYGYRTWQDLTYHTYYGDVTVESEDKTSKLYLGVDYLF